MHLNTVTITDVDGWIYQQLLSTLLVITPMQDKCLVNIVVLGRRQLNATMQ